MAREYQLVIADFQTPVTFDARSIFGWFMFHGLDVSAVLVSGGVLVFLGRRLRDPGALAVERSSDFLPLAGLFAVSVTGLMLPASNLWLEGRFHTFLTTTHALTVILGLMQIPSGKCGDAFASQMQVDDLKDVLPAVGFDYSIPEERGGGNWQDVCPRCRRRLSFRVVSWDRALSRTVAEIQRIPGEYGKDAFAMLSGVSLTNEKSYLIGKFARLALQTRTWTTTADCAWSRPGRPT